MNEYPDEILECLDILRKEVVDKYIIIASNTDPKNPLCMYCMIYIKEHKKECKPISTTKKLVKIGFIQQPEWMEV